MFDNVENISTIFSNVYDVENFLEDIYTSRQPLMQLKASIKRHPTHEVGFTFYYPPQTTTKPILELIDLLDKNGFYM
jgi:hypothetical protein